MSTNFAPAPYHNPAPTLAETASAPLSEQEIDKLQEIHELINLIMKELPVMAQIAARSQLNPTLSTVPYTYSFLQFP
ncbi:MAG: hypothetical protein L0229_08180 [Blastocatellia bacterium]|nr:hypothetical protein [Blastocatellia bacterium]